jgi:guanylate kinase
MNAYDDFLLLILSSPSGAGKTTLTRMLLQRCPDLDFSVSHTTRKPRASEVEGRDYYFVTQEQFLALASQNAFLEWAEVHGNLYGTSIAEIERARATPGCRGMVFDIDYQGARQIKSKVADVVSVFVVPPSLAELERRLRGRASETEDAVQRRFAMAKREIEHYALFEYLIVNHTLDEAFDELRSIVLSERARRGRRAPLAEMLLRTGTLHGGTPSKRDQGGQ